VGQAASANAPLFAKLVVSGTSATRPSRRPRVSTYNGWSAASARRWSS